MENSKFFSKIQLGQATFYRIDWLMPSESKDKDGNPIHMEGIGLSLNSKSDALRWANNCAYAVRVVEVTATSQQVIFERDFK